MHDPKKLLFFLEILERGSMSAAARARGTSRSTAARHLAELEDELGVQLLQRTTRQLALTQAGSVYRERALEIRDMLETVEAEVQGLERAVRGHLRVAVPIIDHQRFLLPLIQAFLHAHPDVTLEFVLAANVRRLVADGFDVGLQMGLDVNASLTMRRLFTEDVALFASAGYAEARGLPASLHELDAHDTLGYRFGYGELEAWPLRDGGVLLPEAPRFTMNSRAMLNDAVLEGMGIGLMMGSISRPHVAAGRLVPVLPDAICRTHSYSLVYAATRHVPSRVRAFVDFTLAWATDVRAQDI